MWWIVLIDCYGNDDFAEPFDHKPTEQQIEYWSEMIGYHCAGAYQANTETEAINLAADDSDATMIIPGA